MKCMTGIVTAIALCSAGSVFAQSGVGGEGKAFDKTVKPLKVFGGLFIPNSNSGGYSTRTGFTLGFGYKFWENNIVTIDGEVRTTVFQVRFNGDDGTLAQVGFMMNIIGHPSRDLFVGIGAGISGGKVDVGGRDFGRSGGGLFQGFIGHDFENNSFVQLRLQSGSQTIQRGWSVELGFRF